MHHARVFAIILPAPHTVLARPARHKRQTAMTTAFLYDDRFLNHNPGAGHPERRERLETTIGHLQTQPWFGQLQQVRSAQAGCVDASGVAEPLELAESVCS